MKLKNVKKCTLTTMLSVLFILPQLPHEAWAAQQSTSMVEVGLPADLFPVSTIVTNNVNDDDDDGSTATNAANTANPPTPNPNKTVDGLPRSTNIGVINPGVNPGGNPIIIVPPAPGTNPIVPVPGGTAPITPVPGGVIPAPGTPIINAGTNGIIDMQPAVVDQAYNCPLFDNGPSKELFTSLDALTKQVMATPECKDDASAASVNTNTQTIKDSIAAIQKLTQSTDGSPVNVSQIETSMQAALTAAQTLGNTLNSNSFLSSSCGHQSMSSGQALLSLNSIVNGISPYALMAVSMNAALLPALPYVIGGVAVTTGISLAEKMYNANTLDMSTSIHRKALIQNTCEFIKVAKKVQFMQMAQSGQIDQISRDLNAKINAYKARFSQPAPQLYSLLSVKDSSNKKYAPMQAQLSQDQENMTSVDQEIAQNSDDLMVCTLSNELVNWASDGKTFPASVINNMNSVVSNVSGNARLQLMTIQSMNQTSIKKITELATKIDGDDSAVQSCAKAGRSWIQGLHQAITMTNNLIINEQQNIDNQLSQNPAYAQWKSQYNLVKIEQLTVSRVEKALQILSQDNSIIDRSELANRMKTLKDGLFGARGMRLPFLGGRPPVAAWLDYTKTMHNRAISDFMNSWNVLYKGSLSFSKTGTSPNFALAASAAAGYAGGEQTTKTLADMAAAKKLSNLNLTNLPLGSAQNQDACQQLESAWTNWSAALDHLGATQLFCNMVDGVLDVNMDSFVIRFCRGDVDLNGKINSLSTINETKAMLVNKGYEAASVIVKAKIKELQCTMPSVSVMNN